MVDLDQLLAGPSEGASPSGKGQCQRSLLDESFLVGDAGGLVDLGLERLRVMNLVPSRDPGKLAG